MSEYGPASETATGDTYNGSPVYRQRFSGASATHLGTLVAGPIVDIVRAGGFLEGNSTDQLPMNEGSTTVGFSVAISPTGDLIMLAYGGWAGDPYDIWVDYTKGP